MRALRWLWEAPTMTERLLVYALVALTALLVLLALR